MNRNSNRKNTLVDNDLSRVVDRARRNEVPPVAWQCVNCDTGDIVIVDESDLLSFERANNIGLMWRISPVLDLNLCDINGNLR